MTQNISKSWGVDLAKLFKEVGNSNKYVSVGANVGRIVSRNPLGISMFEGRVFVYSDIHEIYLTEDVRKKKLSQGDLVLVIADNDNHEFFVVDRVVRG